MKGVLPEKLKIAKVRPLKVVNNFRRISPLSTFYKIIFWNIVIYCLQINLDLRKIILLLVLLWK